jgi:hypothetical protein
MAFSGWTIRTGMIRIDLTDRKIGRTGYKFDIRRAGAE